MSGPRADTARPAPRPEGAGGDGPIFIHGILGRSGTNYLARLLALHPDCALSTLPEDWLLAHADHLVRYVEAVRGRWRRDPGWKIEEGMEEALLQQLGAALADFLSRAAPGLRTITKTPSVEGLADFRRLFPDAPLLLLVRDGRSVAESFARSFGQSQERVAGWWAWAARQILAFERVHGGPGARHRLLRYEDLVHDPQHEVDAILRLVGLDPARYPFDEIERLPVFGSSATRDAAGRWEWRISPATADAVSLERWRGWSRARQERFLWIAGRELEALGYRAERAPAHRLWWRGRTAAWALGGALRRSPARLAGRLRTRARTPLGG